MLLTNELPRLTDNSGAIAKRFLILTLERSFYGQEDQGLAARLVTELSGILNWAIDGYARLRERGYFVQSHRATEAIETLEALVSPIKAFLSDRCELGGQVSVDLIYAHWQEWCQENGHEPSSKQTFGRNLRAAVPALEQTQLRSGESRHRVYTGVCLKQRKQPE